MVNSNMFNNESNEAGEAIKNRAPALRFMISKWIRERGLEGATADECLVHFSLEHQTGSARVTELKQSGDIVASGRRRKTRSGRWAAVMLHRNVALISSDKVGPSRHQYQAISNWCCVLRGELGILEESARFKDKGRLMEEWRLTLRTWRKLRAFVREIES